MVLDEELLKFRKSLNNFSVQYIMVEGFAVNMHVELIINDKKKLKL
jgi:hypothetical protein